MNRRHFLASLPLAAAATRAASASAPRPPNIVLLFADDLGSGDLSSYGCPDIRTPHIDSIGRAGVRFTQFYTNSPECTPSRAALLTGRYQQRVGGLECAIGLGNVGRYDEAVWLQQRGELGLPPTESTLPNGLLAAGYDTAIFGKWHLGYEPKFWPNHHGFQESFVALGGAMDYVTHKEPDGKNALIHNGRPATAEGHYTDVIADRTIAWIKARRRPYFAYVPFTAPHDPFQAPGDGPVAPDAWSRGTRAKYKEMVEHLDRRVGDILAAIRQSPEADNTIVIFLSDNGGTANPGRNAPLRGNKGQLWEGGIRVPCLVSWPRMIPAGRESAQLALNMDLTATLLAVAGAKPPARPLDGINLLDTLRGTRAPFARTIFWRYKRLENRRKAVREGDLKFVDDNGTEALHDLATDPTEKENLLAKLPDRAAALRGKIAAWEKEVAAPRLAAFR